MTLVGVWGGGPAVACDMGAGCPLPHALRSNAKVRPCLLLSSRVASFVGLRYARFVIVL